MHALMNRSAGLLFLLVILISPFRESSAQMLKVSVDELTKASTSVIHGETTSIRSYWTEDRRYIMTDVTIRVQDTVRGQSSSETIITVPGGRVGSTLYEVSDMPVFAEGDEVIVFVSRHESGMNLVVGGSQGMMKVVKDLRAETKSVLGTGQLFESDPKTQPGQEESDVIGLEDFKQRIKDLEGQ